MKRRGFYHKVLLLVTLLLMINSTTTNYIHSLQSEDKSRKSGELNSLTVKIHKPGNNYSSEQYLNWSPNNISQHRVMQISVYAEGIESSELVDYLQIDGIHNDDDFDVIYFSTNFTDYQINSTERGLIFTVLYTYDTEIPSGDFTIEAFLHFSDNSILSGMNTLLTFSEFAYLISPDKYTDVITICSCATKILNFTISNTGQTDSTIIANLSLIGEGMSKFINTRIIESDIDGGLEYIDGGDNFTFQLELTPNSEFDTNTRLAIEPISLDLYYLENDDERVYLLQGNYRLALTPLEDIVTPSVTITHNGGQFTKNFDGEDNIVNDNDIIFTSSNDWLISNYTITNRGYYTSSLSLITQDDDANVKVIFNGLNLTLSDLREVEIQLEQNQDFNFELFLEFNPSSGIQTFNLDVIFNRAESTNTQLRFASSPLEYEKIIFASEQNISYQEANDIESIDLTVDSSMLSGLNYFDNEWSLFCSDVFAIEVIIIELSYSCDQNPIPLGKNVNQVYTLQTRVIEWGLNNTTAFKIGVIHSSESLSYGTTQMVEFSIILSDTNSNQIDNNGTQSNNNNNSDNIGNENNSNVGNNQTSFDIDNDGIPNLVDDCPDTKPGDTVDEFGCTIIDTGTDDDQQNNAEQQQNSDNPASKSDETNVLLYAVIGLIIVAILGGVLVIRNRISAKPNNSAISTVANPVMPLPVMPLAPLEPVLLQQWTDANGYSWRQMSDQTIMWWNGTDWIPYGKN